MNYKLMTILVLAFLSTVFILQNAAVIDVSFLFWSVRMSQVLLMVIVFGVGLLIGLLLNSFLRLRSRQSAQRMEPVWTPQEEKSGEVSSEKTEKEESSETEKPE